MYKSLDSRRQFTLPNLDSKYWCIWLVPKEFTAEQKLKYINKQIIATRIGKRPAKKALFFFYCINVQSVSYALVFAGM